MIVSIMVRQKMDRLSDSARSEMNNIRSAIQAPEAVSKIT